MHQDKSRSLDQERAAHAWKSLPSTVESELVNLAKGAPALIMSNGLMQTLAFYQDKGGKAHKNLVATIASWLHEQRLVEGQDFGKVMTSLHGSSSDTYMLATEETLELLKWVRQLAAARNKEGGIS